MLLGAPHGFRHDSEQMVENTAIYLKTREMGRKGERMAREDFKSFASAGFATRARFGSAA
jgi:hypothetical protein